MSGAGLAFSRERRRADAASRVHDPPAEGKEDVTFHSIFTDKVKEDGKMVAWKGIQTRETPLDWFNE